MKGENETEYESLQKRKAAYKREAILSWIAIIVSLLCLIPPVLEFINKING